MRNILMKEIKLSASCLSFFFILFGLMFFIPGYPIHCGSFFVTLGIFKSYENARETNDILFSALLPIAKKDVVRGKFLFACFIEGCGMLLMAAAVLVRMTILVDSEVYRTNFMMNANGFALGVAIVIFGLFNLVFISGFFKTAYRSLPFLFYIIVCFAVICAAEAVHHVPGLEFFNAFGTDHAAIQITLLLAGILLYLILTLVSYYISRRRFEKIDL